MCCAICYSWCGYLFSGIYIYAMSASCWLRSAPCSAFSGLRARASCDLTAHILHDRDRFNISRGRSSNWNNYQIVDCVYVCVCAGSICWIGCVCMCVSCARAGCCNRARDLCGTYDIKCRLCIWLRRRRRRGTAEAYIYVARLCNKISGLTACARESYDFWPGTSVWRVFAICGAMRRWYRGARGIVYTCWFGGCGMAISWRLTSFNTIYTTMLMYKCIMLEPACTRAAST